MFQVCKVSFFPYLMIDSCLYCETFKKSFPDGITGNHYFFSGALMRSIFLLMENTYCTKREVSLEQRKIGLCPSFCSTPFSVVSHRQDVSLWHENHSGIAIWNQHSPWVLWFPLLFLVYQYCTWNKIISMCSGECVCMCVHTHVCVWCACALVSL